MLCGRQDVHLVLYLCHMMHRCYNLSLLHYSLSSCCRGLHTVTAVGNKLYLFGGASQKGQMQNDLWVLDLSTMQWTQLHPKGEAPHIRCSHTAVLMGQDIVFFGGSYYRYCSVGRPEGAAQADRHRSSCNFACSAEVSHGLLTHLTVIAVEIHSSCVTPKCAARTLGELRFVCCLQGRW